MSNKHLCIYAGAITRSYYKLLNNSTTHNCEHFKVKKASRDAKKALEGCAGVKTIKALIYAGSFQE